MTGTRILVIGAAGSGTSTVGRALASELSAEHFEGDDYYHAPSDPPFQNPRLPVERCERMQQDLAQHNSWVLSGGVVGWEPRPQIELTCVVLLYVPTDVRLERLRRREDTRFGSRIREGGDMFGIHNEFMEWAAQYDMDDSGGNSLAGHEAFLIDQQCPVVEIRGEPGVSDIVTQVIGTLCGDSVDD